MADYQPEEGVVPTNSQVYRVYIERYLCSLPVVNQDLDLIISQKGGYHVRSTYSGLFLFSRNKVWKEYERIQSDIFDHLLAMVPVRSEGISIFGLTSFRLTSGGCLCHWLSTLCHRSGNNCANAMARQCQYGGIVVPTRWHKPLSGCYG